MFYFFCFILLPNPAVVNAWVNHRSNFFTGFYSDKYYEVRSRTILRHLKNIADASNFDNWHIESLKKINPNNYMFVYQCDIREQAIKQVKSYKHDVLPMLDRG